jgi:predicted ATP-dependent serine protease
MTDVYELGQCKECGKDEPLKNGKCAICNAKEVPPDFITEMMKGFKL